MGQEENGKHTVSLVAHFSVKLVEESEKIAHNFYIHQQHEYKKSVTHGSLPRDIA